MSGIALGALAGIGFGLFQAVNRRVNAAMDVYQATFGLILVGSVLLGTIAVATQDLDQLWRAPASALVAFGLAGFVHFFAGWTMLGLSQQRIGAARTGALLGTMPIIGAVAAAIVLGEALTGVMLAALAVVVVGAAAVALSRRRRDPLQSRAPITGVAFALTAASCWALSPLLIRVGLEGLSSPLLGVTVGLMITALAYGVVVAAARRGVQQRPSRAVLGSVVLAGTLVGLSIWSYWTAVDLAQVGMVLAVMQLSAPTVALVSPLVSGDPRERGGVSLWVGLCLIVGGSVTLLLTSG